MIVGGFNHKTIMGDLFVKANCVYSRRHQRRKTLEGTRRQLTKEDPEGLTSGG